MVVSQESVKRGRRKRVRRSTMKDHRIIPVFIFVRGRFGEARGGVIPGSNNKSFEQEQELLVVFQKWSLAVKCSAPNGSLQINAVFFWRFRREPDALLSASPASPFGARGVCVGQQSYILLRTIQLRM